MSDGEQGQVPAAGWRRRVLRDPFGLRWMQALGHTAQRLTIETAEGPAQCVVVGDGPPVVLLHGLDGSARWWHPTLATLAPHFRCYAPNFVRFDRWRERARVPLARSSAFVAALLTALEIDRAHIVAHSMGGYSACRFAIERPAGVDRLVLIAPAVLPRQDRVLREVHRVVPFARAVAPDFLPVLFTDSLRTGPARWLRSARELRVAEPLPLERIAAPTLLIWGDHDPLVPVALGPQVRDRIAGSRLIVLPGSGHVPMYEDPVACNEAIRRFLRDEGGGEAAGDAADAASPGG